MTCLSFTLTCFLCTVAPLAEFTKGKWIPFPLGHCHKHLPKQSTCYFTVGKVLSNLNLSSISSLCSIWTVTVQHYCFINNYLKSKAECCILLIPLLNLLWDFEYLLDWCASSVSFSGAYVFFMPHVAWKYQVSCVACLLTQRLQGWSHTPGCDRM